MLSHQTNVISENEFEIQDLTILNEKTTFKMDEVDAIVFAKNSESDSPDIQQNFVGLMCMNSDRLYMSIRKICDIDVPLFTIKLSEFESGFFAF